jgi:16S rRNA processing protein RimM
LTLVTAGRVGKAHGHDGSFYVERPQDELAPGTVVSVAGEEHTIEGRGGTAERPLLRLSGVDDARRLRGELLLVDGELDEGEWLAADLVGCEVEGAGTVERVVDAPSCSLLELSGGLLVPFISDAIEAVDTDARRIRARSSYLKAP